MSELKFSKKKQTGNRQIDVQEYKAIYSDEETLQGQCENLLDLMKVEYYRVPEDVTRLCSPTHPANVSQRIKNMISKYFLGKPDLLIIKPFDDIYIKAMACELKTAKGKLTGGQKRFQRKVPLIIIRSFEKFEKELNNFLDS